MSQNPPQNAAPSKPAPAVMTPVLVRVLHPVLAGRAQTLTTFTTSTAKYNGAGQDSGGFAIALGEYGVTVVDTRREQKAPILIPWAQVVQVEYGESKP